MVNKRDCISGFVSFAAVLIFVSCSRLNSISTNEDTLDWIRRTGEISACVVVNPPWGIRDAKTGELSGYDIDTLKLIADKMNARVVWHETTWGNMASDLTSKRCDVAPGLFADIERAQSVASTLPAYEYLGHSALVRKNDLRFKNVTDIFEFDKPDLTIAVATGNAGDIFVTHHFHFAKIKRIDVESSDLSRFFMEVTAGRADAAIGAADDVFLYSKVHPEVADVLRGHEFNLEPRGWAVRLDDVKWLHFLETALQYLDTQGTLAKLRANYAVHCLVPKKQYKLQ